MTTQVWTLYWFERDGERLVGEKTFEALWDDVVAEIVGVPVSEVAGGEFEIDEARAQRFEATTGFAVSPGEYEYILGRAPP
jgi:hypothetical protein